jgi:hypothetical protein
MVTADTPTTAAQAAAHWWAEQLADPTFRNDAEPNLAGAMTEMLSELKPVLPTQLQEFERVLAAEIDAQLGRRLATGLTIPVMLGVDYGPDPILGDAADLTGVPLSRFPWKTNMTVHADHVIAALGYRAAWQIIWSAPDWQRPQCGSQHYRDLPEEPYYEKLDEVCSKLRYHEDECGAWMPS